jgi:hypothetical protein
MLMRRRTGGPTDVPGAGERGTCGRGNRVLESSRQGKIWVSERESKT